MFATQFENEEREFRNRKTIVSVTITVLVHALILLFLIFTILHTPVPPFEDDAGGMSVNYGTDETGVGDIQPFTYSPGPTETQTKAASAPAQEDNTPEQVLTQDVEESDVVVPKNDDKPKPKPKQKVNKKALYKPSAHPVETTTNTTTTAPVAEAPPQPKADPNALFHKGAYGTPNNSKGDGTGGAQGDQGKPNGDPNSRNYLGDGGDGNGPGSGPGKGGGFSLKGRKKMGLPAPNNCSNRGRVVIGIKVDRTGKVVEAVFKRFESTVFDECNKNNALNAARRATFNADPNAPEIQEGTITYIYKVD